MLLFLACQGMAQASALDVPSAKTQLAAHTTMAGMPGCHQAESAQPMQGCHTDCQHLDKALDTGNAAVVWFVATTSWPALNHLAGNSSTIPAVTLAFHDPVVDPPPTLRFHRFLE